LARVTVSGDIRSVACVLQHTLSKRFNKDNRGFLPAPAPPKRAERLPSPLRAKN
jgi:hypothetical protein